MKSDLYTKSILTVIAICLTINVLKDFDIMPKAYAVENKSNLENKLNAMPNKNYGLIPVNADGTIDVNIKSSETMDVSIRDIDTYDNLGIEIEYVSGNVKVPVVIKENQDK
jgi:hypothetical protein